MSVFRRRLMGVSRKGSGIDMSNYMTIEALEDGLTASLSRSACEYSIDGGEWVRLAAGTSTPVINVGHIVSFKANNPTANSSYGIGTFTIDKKCNLKGNCMSMLAYDDAANMTTVKMYGFRTLFKNCTNIIKVEKGFLPATTLNNYCYYQMFYGCSDLTTAPDLPATSLKSYCYRDMFYDCVSLTQAPNLPATALGNYCYYGMFYRCSKLETAPALPATTLKDYCYRDMFYGCRSLKTAPELPANNLTTYCYARMFGNCSSLESAPELQSISVSSHSYYQMFYGCSNLVNPPVVAASDLGERTCSDMFNGCTSLISTPSMNIKSMSAYSCCSMFESCINLTSINITISASYLPGWSCERMFYGCYELESVSSLFALKSDSVLDVACCRSMFYDCTKLTTPPSIPSLNLYDACYESMFRHCVRLKSVPELPATTLAMGCYCQMFYDCQNIESVVLPALELVEDCYGQMFFGCKNLRDIKALFLTTPSTTYTHQWVYGVYKNFGTFAKNKDATWDVNGDNGIPYNWTVVTVDGGLATNGNVNINLNGQWERNNSISPDTSLYAAYESVSNVGDDNSEATMYITINGQSSFTLYLRSNAESNYDYAMVSQLNASINGNTLTSSSNVKAHTKGKQNSGTSLSSYIEVVYDNIPSGDNVITVVYRKDSSQSYGTDKAYVLIPK